MAPTHVHNVSTELSDSGEHEAIGSEHVTRDAMKVAILKHKEGCDLHEKVDNLRLWVAGASVVGFIATIVVPVALGWWLSTRLPAPPQQRAASSPSTLINSAHAETKGSTP